jgi:hypothetical protein
MKLRSYSLAAIAASLIVNAAFAQNTSTPAPAKPAVEAAKPEMKAKEPVVAATNKSSADVKTGISKKPITHKHANASMQTQGSTKTQDGGKVANKGTIASDVKKENVDTAKVAVTKTETPAKTTK